MAVSGAVGGVQDTRRGMLAFTGWLTMALLAVQAVVAFLFFFWPRKTGAFGTVISAGKVGDYKVGDIKYFVEGKFYLVRLQEGFIALYQKCPHLGCVVPWKADFEYEGKTGWFRCPCHGSTYERHGGIVFGPAPRPMDYMKISLKGDAISVDTSIIMKRDDWIPTQAVAA
jgi:cytochrome b6-f complex iron-sulfur subunit